MTAMSSPRVVLVVDDSAFARNTTIVCLRGAGLGDCSFLEAEHGKDALDVIRVNAPGLVITDINMPVMDGAGLVRRLRANPKFNTLPVVVVSSVVGPVLEQEFRDIGATAVLRKPLTGPMATSVIAPLLEHSA